MVVKVFYTDTIRDSAKLETNHLLHCKLGLFFVLVSQILSRLKHFSRLMHTDTIRDPAKLETNHLLHCKLGLFFVVCLGLLFSSACTEIQATKAVVAFATEDRPFGDSLMDTQAEISLKSDLFQIYHTYPVELVLIVSERRALVAGYLDNQEQIDEVIQKIWENPYIIKVYNHLEVLPKGSLIDDGDDMVLAKLVAGRLMVCEGVTSANYKTAVFDNIAYVMGLSDSQDEVDAAIAEIKKVGRIRKIRSYIVVAKPEQ